MINPIFIFLLFTSHLRSLEVVSDLLQFSSDALGNQFGAISVWGANAQGHQLGAISVRGSYLQRSEVVSTNAQGHQLGAISVYGALEVSAIGAVEPRVNAPQKKIILSCITSLHSYNIKIIYFHSMFIRSLMYLQSTSKITQVDNHAPLSTHNLLACLSKTHLNPVTRVTSSHNSGITRRQSGNT